jgi:hypothetical protein
MQFRTRRFLEAPGNVARDVQGWRDDKRRIAEPKRCQRRTEKVSGTFF